MKLRQLSYIKKSLTPNNNEWSVDELQLMDINLVVGKNAIGKSRVVKLINKAASIINGIAVDDSFNGATSVTEWQLHFETANGSSLKFDFTSSLDMFDSEKIYFDEKLVLDRTKDNTQIYSYINGLISIAPPLDRLTLQVRRDQKEFPFFEDIVKWAKQLRFFDFTAIDPLDVTSKSLEYHPVNLLERLSLASKQNVILAFNTIGYQIKDIFVEKRLGGAPRLHVVEEGLINSIVDSEMSQGMLRALSVLIFIENLVSNNNVSTVIIDDLSEGLDYERATKLGKLLVEKLENSNIQFIATSNDSFLMDVVPIKYWNILQRDGNTVRALNYQNSKEQFDKFRMTGLSNFDLFSSDYLLQKL